MSLPHVAQFVDLERYPIHCLDTPDYITRLRRDFDQTGACNLEGFITPDGIKELVRETEDLFPLAYSTTSTTNFRFDSKEDQDLPKDHPARVFNTCSRYQIADDQIESNTLLRQLYVWDELTQFIAQIQGKSRLYQFADEFQALNVIYLREGGCSVWHHDDNECTVTLLIQEAERGGDFVYCPNTKSLDGVDDINKIGDAVVRNDPAVVKTLPRTAGTLTLFRGGNSLHSVTPIYGSTLRTTSIMTYDPDPGRTSDDGANRAIYGPRVQRILDERTNAR
jgi:hypothetical protein